MPRILLVSLNTLTLAGVIAINVMAGLGDLGPKDVGEVSRIYDSLFAPAGYAFSIWGFIYLLLCCFVGFQWYAFISKTSLNIIEKTGWYFIVSNAANAAWLLLWVNEYIGLSVLVMAVLLLSLIALVIRLNIALWDAPVRVLVFVWWPVAFYLGWIIVASVANLAAYFTSLSWQGWPLTAPLWTIILILASMGIYLFLIFTRNLRESAVVGIWALVAIAVRQGSANPEITVTAYLAAAVLLAAILYHGYINCSTAPTVKLKRGEF